MVPNTMDQKFVRVCCEEETIYIGLFSREPPVLCCQKHFLDGVLYGVKKAVNLKTKQEIPI